MKAGIVSTIRVNPRDCQSILDLCELLGLPTQGMTFSAMHSMALSSLLETARHAKMIPEPDEFQYLNRMARYIKERGKGKTRIAPILTSRGGEFRAPRMPVTLAEAPPSARSESTLAAVRPAQDAPRPQEQDESYRWASQRLAELLAKQDAVSDEIPGIKWTENDQDEFDKCYALLYPVKT